jgi:hypothetical protein
VFAALVGQPRAEGLTRIDQADLGRLIGLDRAPEVKPCADGWGSRPPGTGPTGC